MPQCLNGESVLLFTLYTMIVVLGSHILIAPMDNVKLI